MRPNLVVVRCGAQSRHLEWLGAGGRSWDLAVCPYEPIPAGPEDARSPGVIAKAKYAGLFDYLGAEEFWRAYDYVWLPDDDLTVSSGAIDAMFGLCRASGARLAAPGLAPGSHYSHAFTLANTSFVWRRTSFVEMMMPCWRTDVLGKLLPSFAESSGQQWGLDYCWARRLDYDGIYILDDVQVTHGRPVGGARGRGEDAEARRAMRKLMAECDAHVLKVTLAGRLHDGTELDRFDPLFMDVYVAGYAWLDFNARQIERRFVAPQRQVVPAG